MVKNKVSKLMVDTLYPDRNQMPQPCLDVLSMSRFSTDAVSDTYTCRDLDNMTTAAFTKQHTFCSSITSANFEGGGGSRLALARLTQVGGPKSGKTKY